MTRCYGFGATHQGATLKAVPHQLNSYSLTVSGAALLAGSAGTALMQLRSLP